jgi:hypothetical protein
MIDLPLEVKHLGMNLRIQTSGKGCSAKDLAGFEPDFAFFLLSLYPSYFRAISVILKKYGTRRLLWEVLILRVNLGCRKIARKKFRMLLPVIFTSLFCETGKRLVI